MPDLLSKQYKPKIKLQIGEGYRFVNDTVKEHNLNTVCAEANCPNIYECWSRGTKCAASKSLKGTNYRTVRLCLKAL